MNDQDIGVIEAYGWDPERQDYFLVYRGTDEKEAERLKRKHMRWLRRYWREHPGSF